jgi:hypothetical protein
MRVSIGGGRVLSAPGSFPSSSITGKGTATCGSPGNAGRVRTLGAEPMTLGQQPARVWRRAAGGS